MAYCNPKQIDYFCDFAYPYLSSVDCLYTSVLLVGIYVDLNVFVFQYNLFVLF